MSARLHRRCDVRRVLSRGRVHHGRHTVTRVRTRGDAAPGRWTVSAGAKVGTAVARNRAKRRLRAVVRELGVPTGVDAVIIARRSAVTAPQPELRDDLRALNAPDEPMRGASR